jgi:hypothetical protein
MYPEYNNNKKKSKKESTNQNHSELSPHIHYMQKDKKKK